MKGGELFQHLRLTERFDENRAKFIVAEIALALGYLHENNIIYRDLKPENIFSWMKMVIFAQLILDCLKLSYKMNQLRLFVELHNICPLKLQLKKGTQFYFCDWWALGILTFEMLFSVSPFSSENTQQVYQVIKHQNIHFPEEISISAETQNSGSRLGSFKDLEDIKSHPSLAGIDWQALYNKKLVPPFKTNMEQWELYFDEEFTQEETLISFDPNTNKEILDQYQTEFDGFSYNPNKRMAQKHK